MILREREAYQARGLDDAAFERLSVLGDAVLQSRVNVTALRTAEDIERGHFLDSLSLLDLDAFQRRPLSVVDVGSGGGFPALVLAVTLAGVEITAVESVGKKCAFITSTAERLGLDNLRVVCARAEDVGRGRLRESFDLAVTRAVGSLSLVAELSAPLVRPGGWVVAMKGGMSQQERAAGLDALAILGVDRVEEMMVVPFAGAQARRLVVGRKGRPTPRQYPRGAGLPAKRPLGHGAGREAQA